MTSKFVECSRIQSILAILKSYFLYSVVPSDISRGESYIINSFLNVEYM